MMHTKSKCIYIHLKSACIILNSQHVYYYYTYMTGLYRSDSPMVDSENCTADDDNGKHSSNEGCLIV